MNLGMDCLTRSCRQMSVQTQQKRQQNDVCRCFSNISIDDFEQAFTQRELKCFTKQV